MTNMVKPYSNLIWAYTVVLCFKHIEALELKSVIQESIPGCRMSLQTSEGTRWLDLRSLGEKSFETIRPVNDSHTTFLWNPCFPFDVKLKDLSESCFSVLVAEKTYNRSCQSLGEIAKSSISNNQVVIQYSKKLVSNTVRSTVRLVCADESHIKDSLLCVNSCINSRNPVFEFKSRHACPHDDGLSPGSIFLIVLFTVLGVYFLVGTAIGAIKGRVGLDKLPHAEFWLELPYLVKDGIIFTCCCKRRKPPPYKVVSGHNYDDRAPIVSL